EEPKETKQNSSDAKEEEIPVISEKEIDINDIPF
ncbi:unnamed protein product, partial [marine sediment metagenome]